MKLTLLNELKTLVAKATPLPYHVAPDGSEKYIGSTRGLIADMCRNKCGNDEQLAECDANAKLFTIGANEILPTRRKLEKAVKILRKIDEAFERSPNDEFECENWKLVKQARAFLAGLEGDAK